MFIYERIYRSSVISCWSKILEKPTVVVVIVRLVFSLKINFNLGYSNLHVFSILRFDSTIDLTRLELSTWQLLLDLVLQNINWLYWFTYHVLAWEWGDFNTRNNGRIFLPQASQSSTTNKPSQMVCPAIVDKCPDVTQTSLFLQHLSDLMSLACVYQWSAVRAFHYKVREMGLFFRRFWTAFLCHLGLNSQEKARKTVSSRPCASKQPLRHQIWDNWPWLDDYNNDDCSKLHFCIVCMRPDHQAKNCLKRKFDIPPFVCDCLS